MKKIVNSYRDAFNQSLLNVPRMLSFLRSFLIVELRLQLGLGRSSRPCRFAESQCKQSTQVGDVLQALEQRYQVQQIVIGWITDPAFNRNSVVCAMISRWR